jgi:hypothetical protein
MDAVLLREAGGLGDILQIGSTVPLLRSEGYVVHLYTLPDPALIELAKLIRGISYVHPLRVSVNERRNRGNKSYQAHRYLSPVLAHVLGTTQGTSRNKLFDMFCPAWSIEQKHVKQGEMPRYSRAQCFVGGAGFHSDRAKPTRLRRPVGLGGMMRVVEAQLGGGRGYTVFAPWSKDPARSMKLPVQDCIDALVDEFGPLVVLDYATGDGHYQERENVFWYPQDLGKKPDRGQAVLHTAELMWHASRVVTVDSFALHLAGSLAKRIVLMPGPTVTGSVAKHYEDVVSCESAERPKCLGCYYQRDRGFRDSCRVKGCGVIDSLTPGDVVTSLKEACA